MVTEDYIDILRRLTRLTDIDRKYTKDVCIAFLYISYTKKGFGGNEKLAAEAKTFINSIGINDDTKDLIKIIDDEELMELRYQPVETEWLRKISEDFSSESSSHWDWFTNWLSERDMDGEEFTKLVNIFLNRHISGSDDDTDYIDYAWDIRDIVFRLWDLKEGDIVADFSSLRGNLLLHAVKEADKSTEFIGFESDKVRERTSRICIDMLQEKFGGKQDAKIETENKNPNDRNTKIPQFDKAVVCIESPRTRRLMSKADMYADWDLIMKLLAAMNPGGRLIVLADYGVASRQRSSDIRGNVVNAGFVEGVISMGEHVWFPQNIIVFTENNKETRFYECLNEDMKTERDPYSLFETEKKYFNDEVIVKKYNESNITATPADMKEQEYNLVPRRYIRLVNESKSPDTKKFDTICDISTTTQYTASKFTVVPGKTNDRLLSPGDFDEDGRVVWDNLKCIERYRKMEDHRIQKGDILITNKSATINVFLIDDEFLMGDNKDDFPDLDDEDVRIIAIGGMIKISCRSQYYVRPEYLHAYLLSEQGQKQLESVIQKYNKGNVKAIDVAALKELRIELPDKDMQDRLADAYVQNKKSYLKTKKRLADLRKEYISTLDTEYFKKKKVDE